MKIYALICHNLVLTQFWPRVVSWRFEITTDAAALPSPSPPRQPKQHPVIKAATELYYPADQFLTLVWKFIDFDSR